MRGPTRRTVLAGMLAGIAAPALRAACAASADASNPAGADAPRRFEHAFGVTTVPAAPRRVASLGFMEHDTVLALGVVPVAIKGWFQQFPSATGPWAAPLLGDARPVSLAGNDIPFEALLKLRPDLIVAIYTNLNQEQYDRLSMIAPTLAWTAQAGPWGTYWEDNVRILGRALFRDARAQACIDRVHAAFARARERFPQLSGARGLAGNSTNDTFVIRGPRYDAGAFLTSLGVRYPQDVLARLADRPLTHFSWEQADLLGQGLDVVLWDIHGARTVAETADWMQRLGVYDGQGKFVFNRANDVAAAAVVSQSVLSMPYAIDLLGPRLEAAVEAGRHARQGPSRGSGA